MLEATERGAHVAMDRLEEKLNGHVPAEELAQELADDLRALEKAAASRGRPDGGDAAKGGARRGASACPRRRGQEPGSP